MPSYKDMLGMYRTAIARGINIIAMDEGEISEEAAYVGVHENLIRIIGTVNGPITLIDGNLSILDEELEKYNEDERVILEKLHIILCSLPDIDKEITKTYKED